MSTAPIRTSLCWTVAQEVAHAFGLEHEYNAVQSADLLERRTVDEAVPGHRLGVRRVQRAIVRREVPGSGPTQNSYEHILGFFGPGAVTPPMVKIKLPANNKKVTPGFRINATATDDVGIDHLELWIDGMNTGATSDTAPYLLSAPARPRARRAHRGGHRVRRPGRAGERIDPVTVGPPCTASSGCSGTDACVMGVCLPARSARWPRPQSR